MGFAADLKRLCDAAGDKAETVVRRAATEIGGDMIDPSAVDTGRFKNNWMSSVGAMDKSTTDAVDKTGEGSKERLRQALATWKPGQTIWIVNNLPYAHRLEYGWSQQMPSGVVRIAVQRYKEAVAKAARELK